MRKSSGKKKPLYDSDDTVSPRIQAFLSSLTPDQLTESVEISCYGWPAKMVREVMANLKPKPRALYEFFGEHYGSGKELAELQKELGFSAEETQQAFADLRSQLKAMGIHPQEVYHINFMVTEENEQPTIYYFGNHEFGEGYGESRGRIRAS